MLSDGYTLLSHTVQTLTHHPVPGTKSRDKVFSQNNFKASQQFRLLDKVTLYSIYIVKLRIVDVCRNEDVFLLGTSVGLD